jgi:hypothetical protein
VRGSGARAGARRGARLRAALELGDLAAERGAAVRADARQAELPRKALDVLADLDDQLARGRHDQRDRPVALPQGRLHAWRPRPSDDTHHSTLSISCHSSAHRCTICLNPDAGSRSALCATGFQKPLDASRSEQLGCSFERAVQY